MFYKPHKYGYQMKSLDLVIKNMLFVDQFMLRSHFFSIFKQTNTYI